MQQLQDTECIRCFVESTNANDTEHLHGVRSTDEIAENHRIHLEMEECRTEWKQRRRDSTNENTECVEQHLVDKFEICEETQHYLTDRSTDANG